MKYSSLYNLIFLKKKINKDGKRKGLDSFKWRTVPFGSSNRNHIDFPI